MATLTDAQKQKLPPELRVILQRFHHDPQLLTQLKHLLILSAQKIAQYSINHETFCDTFQIPQKLPNELLKLYGVTDRELKQAMRKVGFVEIHRMYNDTYYQTMAIAYLIGLEFDNKDIRRLALLMITIKLWNGRKHRAFPTFCDPDIARYVMNYVLKGNHTLKKMGGSVFQYLDGYLIPAVDDTYHERIANNLNDPREGLRKLLETNWSRINQLFASIRNAYYKTQKEGKKEITSEKYHNQYGGGDMVETKESFSGVVERLVDKIEKNSMLRKNILQKSAAIEILKRKFKLSQNGIQKISQWVEDEDNRDELRYFYELLFNTLKPRNETDICKYDVESLATRLTSAKKDPNLIKAKEILDHAAADIVGDYYSKAPRSSVYYAKSFIAHALIIYAKLMLCKKL